MVESIIVFLLILAVSSAIYLLGRHWAPKPHKTEDKILMYTCGERMRPKKVKITVTLYKYLIYFVIIDSSVLIMAFAALVVDTMNPLPLLVYLFTIAMATLLLLGGD
ncbi:MAG: NADH-quinone oxidoreductase subunit A [Candidatus Bathyarchaeota archaeon]|nr:NADH-quinone oxidoreductase subunit A [Candidatus Bathyarchaeota archaeon]MDH5419598.1 NADH-quinone oxidoreductase subunit A [Candidatus Bathyarchaeota archaeon]MDH5622990.1 NADH-quinone oxidoreductase subunit A [Candidatus Bathyarchaeota archaeon]MDH5635221.1 NADH-quinone oxidoreductase subunit A [Candidatus Bathyarchaeota archaeon]MDH5702145.1 NADH-quinone oxidoreductase subunit A [Candidatus Bathyarchaeota archaeon]